MDTTLKIKLLNELTTLLGDRVSDSETIRNEHGGGFTYHENKPPDIVVYPHSTMLAKCPQLCETTLAVIGIIPFSGQ